MSIELKKCPVCGQNAELHCQTVTGIHGTSIFCDQSKGGCGTWTFGVDPYEANRKWNTGIVSLFDEKANNPDPLKIPVRKIHILRLTLVKKWFDMILSGEKTEEYRLDKAHWARILDDIYIEGDFPSPKYFDAVDFRNGYQKDSRRLLARCVDNEYRTREDVIHQEWGEPEDDHHAISIGKIFWTNCGIRT